MSKASVNTGLVRALLCLNVISIEWCAVIIYDYVNPQSAKFLKICLENEWVDL